MIKKHKTLLIPLLTAITTIVVFWFVSLRLPVVLIFIPGVIITFVVYLFTFYKKTTNTERILPLYLFALGIQFIHFTEEYLAGFTKEMPRLLGQPEYSLDYWVVFNMIAYSIFIIGGIILYKRIQEFMIIPLFFMLVGVLFNAVGHIILSLYTAGYFPGLYSALFYIVIIPSIIKAVMKATRNSKNLRNKS